MVDDRPFLPGHLGGLGIEGHGLQPGGGGRAHGHVEHGPATAIGVDHEIDGRAPHLPRVGVEREVLEPHARMEELRLMAAHHERPADPVGHVGGPRDVAVLARVFGRHHQHLAAGGGHELVQPHVADPQVEGRPQEAVVVDERLDRTGARPRHDRRLDQPGPRGLGGLVDAAASGHRRGEPVGRAAPPRRQTADRRPAGRDHADPSTPPQPRPTPVGGAAAGFSGGPASRRRWPPRPGRAPAGSRPGGFRRRRGSRQNSAPRRGRPAARPVRPP